MSEVVFQFVLAMFCTLGFAIIFRVPVRHIPVCIVVGAMGWATYVVTVYFLDSPVIGCFTGACMVGMLSTIASYVFKDATTIFIIPGILCLVPGSKIFETMEELLKHQVEDTAETGLLTLEMAGAIAMGLLVMGACTGIVTSVFKKAVAFVKNKRFFFTKS